MKTCASKDIGFHEGDRCNRNNCLGILAEREKEGSCSCHINPPCSVCVDDRAYCPECGWEGIEEQRAHNDNLPKGTYTPIKYRTLADLDNTKIDWISSCHTHFTMIKEGVYPETATRKDVEEKVRGTFGGHFESFGNGKFKYIDDTD